MKQVSLLILNSDDWGARASATNAILECFKAGATTSASAMVFMRDSTRAADLARAEGLPTGLHLNLSESFDSTAAAAGVRERQRRLVRSFRGRRIKGTRRVIYPKRWVTYPYLCRAVYDSISDQIEEFRRLYEREPTHIDGHHDVHLRPTVLMSGGIPDGVKIRNTYSRHVRHFAVSGFVMPDAFISMRELRPEKGASLASKLAHLDAATVEISQHPHLGEKQYLLSEQWLFQLRGLPLGSFNDLKSRHAAKTPTGPPP